MFFVVYNFYHFLSEHHFYGTKLCFRFLRTELLVQRPLSCGEDLRPASCSGRSSFSVNCVSVKRTSVKVQYV
jgi:hypothetical protein